MFTCVGIISEQLLNHGAEHWWKSHNLAVFTQGVMTHTSEHEERVGDFGGFVL